MLGIIYCVYYLIVIWIRMVTLLILTGDCGFEEQSPIILYDLYF